MSHAVFEKIKRIKERSNTWQKYFGRILCVLFLFLNAFLIAIWLGPEHVRKPVSQKIHDIMPQAAHDHVAARVGVNVKNAHSKNYNSNNNDGTNDLDSLISQQNEDRDVFMVSSGICGGGGDILLIGGKNNDSTTSSIRVDYENEDTETRLSKYGFKTVAQTCSNFETLREESSSDSSIWWNRGKLVAPGLFRCQFLLSSAGLSGPSKKVQQNDDKIPLDNCWCSKKYSNMITSSSSSSHSLRDLKRYTTTFSNLFMLNGSVTLRTERISGRLPLPPYCTNEELERVRQEFSVVSQTTGSSTNISNNKSNADETKSSPPPKSNNNEIITITNATLRDVLKQVTKLRNRLRSSALHISKNTRILPKSSTKKASKPKKDEVTMSEAFIHIAASQLHHNFEGKKCLVWSSRKLPTVEVTMFALSGAKHVDAVATQAYRTTVPSMTVYTPPEFVAKITARENLKIEKQNKNKNNKNTMMTKRVSPPPQYQYGAIISFMTLHELGLGRFGEAIDPFADFHAMNEFWHLLQPGGTLLLVIPVGGDCFDFNQQRVYGRSRLAVLLRGWAVDFSVGITSHTLNPLENPACDDESKVTEALIVLRRSVVNWEDRESVESDGIGRIPGLLL